MIILEFLFSRIEKLCRPTVQREINSCGLILLYVITHQTVCVLSSDFKQVHFASTEGHKDNLNKRSIKEIAYIVFSNIKENKKGKDEYYLSQNKTNR